MDVTKEKFKMEHSTLFIGLILLVLSKEEIEDDYLENFKKYYKFFFKKKKE